MDNLFPRVIKDDESITLQWPMGDASIRVVLDKEPKYSGWYIDLMCGRESGKLPPASSTLEQLRWLQELFFEVGSAIEEVADGMDTAFQDELRAALADDPFKPLVPPNLSEAVKQLRARANDLEKSLKQLRMKYDKDHPIKTEEPL